jgi:hypothetical protein
LVCCCSALCVLLTGLTVVAGGVGVWLVLRWWPCWLCVVSHILYWEAKERVMPRPFVSFLL